MNREEYNQRRQKAYEAAQAYTREANEDGRSSYASHWIRVNHALQHAQLMKAMVPHDAGGKDLFMIRSLNRRRYVIQCIKDRNHAREHTPGCLRFYEHQLRKALHCLDK